MVHIRLLLNKQVEASAIVYTFKWNIESQVKYSTINYTAVGWNNMANFFNCQPVANNDGALATNFRLRSIRICVNMI